MTKALRVATDAVFYFGIVLWITTSQTAVPFLTVCAVIIHEFGHILASQILGCGLGGLSLQAGGLMLKGKKPYGSYFAEAAVAFAGPFFNILSVLAFWSASGDNGICFKQVSAALAILNLLPIDGFDGGRLLGCFLSAVLPYGWSERICGALSFLSLFVLWCASVYLLMRTGRSLTLFVFSALIFLRILRKNGTNRINEIIRG